MRALATRVRMIGGGNAYDLYIPVEDCPPHALAANPTQVLRDGRRFLRYAHATRPAADIAMPPGWEKYEQWTRHERAARREAAGIVRRCFPEMTSELLPELWIEGMRESAELWLELRAPGPRAALPHGMYYSTQSDGHRMLCNADGTRSIFDDVDD